MNDQIRARVYHDASSRLPPGQRRLFLALACLPGLAEAISMEGPAASQYSTMSEATRVHHDAQTLVATARQLEFVMSQAYEEPMPELKLAEGQVIDFDTSVPEGARSFVWYAYSGSAIAQFTAAWAEGSAPLAQVQGAAVTGQIKGMENGYAYTMDDLRSAAFAGVQLDPSLSKYARRGHAERLNKTALWGREDLALPGLVTHPNITIFDAPLNGASSSRYWVNKSVDEILRDNRVLAQTANQVSYRTRKTSNIWIPQEEYDLISTLRLGAGDGGMTVLDFLRKVHPGITWDVLDELAASLSDGNLATDSALALVRNRDLLNLVVPMAFRQHPPQQVNLTIKVMCESKIGGVVMKEPPTVVRMDQIGAS
jgi:hypothetical protein